MTAAVPCVLRFDDNREFHTELRLLLRTTASS
jgi:hypothetical protein